MSTLIIALLATAAAIAIHFLNRGRSRPLLVGDIRLFRESGARSRQLTRLRDRLLLALRLALLAALTAWLWRPASGPGSVADGSQLPTPAVLVSPLALDRADLSPAREQAQTMGVALRVLAPSFPPVEQGAGQPMPAFARLEAVQWPREGRVVVYLADTATESTAVMPELPANVEIRRLAVDHAPLRIGVAESSDHPDRAELLWTGIQRLATANPSGLLAACHAPTPDACPGTMPELWFAWVDEAHAEGVNGVRWVIVDEGRGDGETLVPPAEPVLGRLPSLVQAGPRVDRWAVEPALWSAEDELLEELEQLIWIVTRRADARLVPIESEAPYAWFLPVLILLLLAAERLTARGTHVRAA